MQPVFLHSHPFALGNVPLPRPYTSHSYIVVHESAPRSHGGNNVRQKIDTLLAHHAGMDFRVKKAIIGLTRKLIATKHAFPPNSGENSQEPYAFDLQAPIKKLSLSYNGVAQLLHDISPRLAEDEDIVDGILKISNDSVPGRHARSDRPDSLVAQIDARKAPIAWPDAAMRYVLRLGNWETVNAQGADLRNGNFRGVQWLNANFHKALLQGSDLSGSDLRHSDLRDTNLSNCDLSRANLTAANMESAVADGANLYHADLTSVHAKDAFFLKAKFDNATLRQANFEGAHLEYTTGLSFQQGALFGDAELFHARIGHNIEPQLSGNLKDLVTRQLSTLATIHSRHDGLHNEMVWRLLDATGADCGRLTDLGALTKTLLSQKRCWPDERLKRFVDNQILPPLLTRWNLDVRAKDEPSFAKVTDYLTATESVLDWPAYCGAASQLLNAAEQASTPNRRDALSALIKAHPAIAPIAAALDQLSLESFQECSVFVSPGLHQAIVYPNTCLQQMLNKTGSPYNGYYFVRDTKGVFTNAVLRDLDTIEACAVPLGLYNIEPPPLAAVALLSHIFDGAPSTDRFIQALTCKTMPPRKVDAAYISNMLIVDVQLMQRLTKFFRAGAQSESINELSRQKFLKIFNSVAGPLPLNTANVARLLLCLGTLFVRYSSAPLFGSADESLNSLRIFAWACINSADMLDEALLEGTAESIGHTLKGKHNHLQCSDTLAQKLVRFISERTETDPVLATCFKAIYPQSGM
jgi:uncharacterized protein YjbI with pentapeptide repeats